MAEYINRGTALAKLTALEVTEPNATMEDAKRVLADIPAAYVAPVVHGRWEQCFEDWRKQIEGDKFSICGFEHYSALITHYHYCPNCGAQMHENDFCSYGECREGKDEK